MKLITAVIRNICLDKVITELNSIGVKGMTVFAVKGRGEEVVLYRDYSLHSRIEIIAPDHEVDKVRQTILDVSCTGERGDGVITVQDIREFTRIRTGKTISSEGA